MSLTNDPARPDAIRVVVHQVRDRRGRLQFLATRAGRALCFSKNPIACTASALLEAGYDPSTQIRFRDAATGIEEAIPLTTAIAWQMPGVAGEVVPFRRPTRPTPGSGGDA